MIIKRSLLSRNAKANNRPIRFPLEMVNVATFSLELQYKRFDGNIRHSNHKKISHLLKFSNQALNERGLLVLCKLTGGEAESIKIYSLRINRLDWDIFNISY